MGFCNLPFVPVAAVFDVDETILDNGHAEFGTGYHELFRLQAVHEIGRERGLPTLTKMTYADSLQAFRTAHEHTFVASLWNMLCMAGLKTDPIAIDYSDELLVSITALKDSLYAEALRTKIKPIIHAKELIHTAFEVCNGRVAIASSAKRQDIDLFLSSNDLLNYFKPSNIVSIEDISHPKPNPEAFTKAFRTLGLSDADAANSLAFEDAPNGVASAKQTNLYTIAITTHYSRMDLESATHPPDRIIDGYTEILEV